MSQPITEAMLRGAYERIVNEPVAPRIEAVSAAEYAWWERYYAWRGFVSFWAAYPIQEDTLTAGREDE